MSKSDLKVAIIGGGPAGIASAIQLKRYGLNPVIFEPERIGGLLHGAWRVENYPGFPDGISGCELAEVFKIHLEKYDIKVRRDRIELLEYYDTVHRFELRTAKASFSPDYVIVASGTKPIKNDILEILSKKCLPRIYYDIFPLLKKRGKRIGIIGAGDAAFDYAMNLGENNEIILLNRTDNISALPSLQNEEKKRDNVTYCENVRIILINFSSTRNRLAVTMAKFDETWLLDLDYLVSAIGREPQKCFYSENLLKKESALIGNGQLFPVGDIKNGLFRQTAIAVGDGIRAAMDIYNRIQDEKE